MSIHVIYDRAVAIAGEVIRWEEKHMLGKGLKGAVLLQTIDRQVRIKKTNARALRTKSSLSYSSSCMARSVITGNPYAAMNFLIGTMTGMGR